MFKPNQMGRLYRRTGRDVHGRSTLSAPIDLPFAPVNLAAGAQKTSVRTDSSASRGAADETVALRAKILTVKYVPIAVGDRFEFDGASYLIATINPRRSVLGALDHFECDLEIVQA